jgi:hypothetical protein
MLRLAGLLVAALVVAAPAAADASRKPTRQEARGVAKKMGVPVRCATIRVSTVSERWASARIKLADKRCERWAVDGMAIFKRRRRAWRFVVAGSAFDCPVRQVPRRVQRDLKIPCM